MDDWKRYINGNQFLDYTMERDSRKNEDGKSDNSDTYSDGMLERIGSQPVREKEDGEDMFSNMEDMIPLMQRI